MADWVKAKGQGFEPVQFSSVEARLAQRTAAVCAMPSSRTRCSACARAHARLRSLTVGRRGGHWVSPIAHGSCAPHLTPSQRFSVLVGCAECSLPSEYSSTRCSTAVPRRRILRTAYLWLGLAYRTAQRRLTAAAAGAYRWRSLASPLYRRSACFAKLNGKRWPGWCGYTIWLQILENLPPSWQNPAILSNFEKRYPT
jgi:hypothetical protein